MSNSRSAQPLEKQSFIFCRVSFVPTKSIYSHPTNDSSIPGYLLKFSENHTNTSLSLDKFKFSLNIASKKLNQSMSQQPPGNHSQHKTPLMRNGKPIDNVKDFFRYTESPEFKIAFVNLDSANALLTKPSTTNQGKSYYEVNENTRCSLVIGFENPAAIYNALRNQTMTAQLMTYELTHSGKENHISPVKAYEAKWYVSENGAVRVAKDEDFLISHNKEPKKLFATTPSTVSTASNQLSTNTQPTTDHLSIAKDIPCFPTTYYFDFKFLPPQNTKGIIFEFCDTQKNQILWKVVIALAVSAKPTGKQIVNNCINVYSENSPRPNPNMTKNSSFKTQYVYLISPNPRAPILVNVDSYVLNGKHTASYETTAGTELQIQFKLANGFNFNKWFSENAITTRLQYMVLSRNALTAIDTVTYEKGPSCTWKKEIEDLTPHNKSTIASTATTASSSSSSSSITTEIHKRKDDQKTSEESPTKKPRTTTTSTSSTSTHSHITSALASATTSTSSTTALSAASHTVPAPQLTNNANNMNFSMQNRWLLSTAITTAATISELPTANIPASLPTQSRKS
ncbi:hypothetical protein AYO45_06330 [Gammaproteobacteria bacterium SCGC AG-212-F23]|nr:hypothetical protein AYO45_06330 [Gammaproteobacteria bacterium SCGC AG-212-F23]